LNSLNSSRFAAGPWIESRLPSIVLRCRQESHPHLSDSIPHQWLYGSTAGYCRFVSSCNCSVSSSRQSTRQSSRIARRPSAHPKYWIETDRRDWVIMPTANPKLPTSIELYLCHGLHHLPNLRSPILPHYREAPGVGRPTSS